MLLSALPAVLPFPDIDPVLIRLGPLAIHWYGVGYVVGILFGWWYARRLASTPSLWAHGKPPMTLTDLDDFVVWAAAGIVLGGRVGYVLFYDFARFAAEPLRIFAVWEGGMSFHGGMLGSIAAMVLFALRRGIDPYSMIDVCAASAPPALGLVRVVGNFFNSELWGRPTDLPWGVIFPNGGPEPRHPSQLYEALLEGLVLFLALRFLTHTKLKLKTPRYVGGAFVFVYGLSRIVVEFFREPDAQLGYLLGTGWFTMGMALSLPMLAVGLWAFATAREPAAS